jgi:hypothetical protein
MPTTEAEAQPQPIAEDTEQPEPVAGMTPQPEGAAVDANLEAEMDAAVEEMADMTDIDPAEAAQTQTMPETGLLESAGADVAEEGVAAEDQPTSEETATSEDEASLEADDMPAEEPPASWQPAGDSPLEEDAEESTEPDQSATQLLIELPADEEAAVAAPE